MNPLDQIRSLFDNEKCERAINYDKRNLQLNFNVEAVAAKFSLSDFKTEQQKIRDASEFAEMLDNYQYLMCKAIHGFGKHDQEWRKYNKIRIGAYQILFSLQATLMAFKNDPENQKSRLDDIVSRLQDYFNLVSNEVFTSAENSRLESKEDIPEVKEGTVSRALNIADLKEEETDKIIENYASTNVTDGSGNPNLHRFITYLSHIKRIGHEVINRQHTTIEQPHENREYNVMVGRIPSIPPSLFNIISHMSLDNGIPVDYIPQYHLSLLSL